MGVTLVGREEIAENIHKDGSGQPLSALNIGEGDTAFDPSDSSLENELDFEGGLTTSRNSDKVIIQTEFTDNQGAVTEAGMVAQGSPSDSTQASFDGDNDVQVIRQQIPEINVLEEDKIDLTFELQALNDGSN